MNTNVDSISICFDRPFCLLMISPPKHSDVVYASAVSLRRRIAERTVAAAGCVTKKNTTQNNVSQSDNLQLLCKLCNPLSQPPILDGTTKFTGALLNYSWHIRTRESEVPYSLLSQLKCRMHDALSVIKQSSIVEITTSTFIRMHHWSSRSLLGSSFPYCGLFLQFPARSRSAIDSLITGLFWGNDLQN